MVQLLSSHHLFIPFELWFSSSVICPIIQSHPCSSPSLPSFIPPSISCFLSWLIPGSVSARRLSALKLSQRRFIAKRNPSLRGNYLPHRLQQHGHRDIFCTWTRALVYDTTVHTNLHMQLLRVHINAAFTCMMMFVFAMWSDMLRDIICLFSSLINAICWTF